MDCYETRKQKGKKLIIDINMFTTKLNKNNLIEMTALCVGTTPKNEMKQKIKINILINNENKVHRSQCL